MINPRDYIGRPFVIGKTDCYSLIRDFYRDAFDIEMRNYARPVDYHLINESMYDKWASAEGFEPYVGGYADIQYGDVFMMNLDAEFVNHVGVYIGQGDMLHHYWGRLSEICKFGGVWMTYTMGIMRHRDLKDFKLPDKSIDALEVLPPHVRHRINATREVPIDWEREDWRDQLRWDDDRATEPVRSTDGGVSSESG